MFLLYHLFAWQLAYVLDIHVSSTRFTALWPNECEFGFINKFPEINRATALIEAVFLRGLSGIFFDNRLATIFFRTGFLDSAPFSLDMRWIATEVVSKSFVT